MHGNFLIGNKEKRKGARLGGGSQLHNFFSKIKLIKKTSLINMEWTNTVSQSARNSYLMLKNSRYFSLRRKFLLIKILITPMAYVR
jgi:hypothetical protein